MSNCTAGLQSDWFNYNSFTTNKQIVTYFLYFFKKMGHPLASFSFIFYLFKQTIQFLQQINLKNVHPVYGAGIRTHGLLNMSRHP